MRRRAGRAGANATVRGPAERGVALVIVLLTLSLLLTVAGQFALAMRLEGTTTVNFRGAATARFLAEAAYHRAVAEILAETVGPGFPGPSSVPAGAPRPILPTHMVQLDERGTLVFRRSRLTTPQAPEREVPLGPGRLEYRITDEESRISLNQPMVPQFSELLHALLAELGVERTARDVIVDSILDWRDPNEEHRLNGAESDYYQGLPVPYRSKNADFDSVDELLQVRGVTREMLYGRPESPGLAEFVTAALPAGSGVNLNTASPTVLRAMGCAPAQADTLVANRPYLQPADLKIQCQWRLPTQQRLFRSQTFRIEATGEVPGQGRRILEAIVRREPKDGVARVVRKTWRWIEERTP